MKPYAWLYQQRIPGKSSLLMTIICGLVMGVCLIAQSYLLAKILSHYYLNHATLTTLKPLLSSLVIIICIRAIFSFFREKFAFQTANNIKQRLRRILFENWMRENLSQKADTGARTSVLIENIEGLHGFFADYLPQMSITVILPIIILGFVFSQNWLCGLILLVCAPLIPIFMIIIGMQTAKLKKENFVLLAKLSNHFLNTLQGLSTLSLFNRARAQTQSIESLSNEFRLKTMTILRVAFLSSAALELFATISIAIIAVYLGLGLLGNIHIGFPSIGISLQAALFILLLAPEFFLPLRKLGDFYHARSEAMGAAELLMPELSQRSASSSQSPIFLEKNIAINLNNITFSYNKTPLITDLSLTIPFGACLTITGESGAGKSTLLHLIAKLLTPQSGSITTNGIDIATIDDDNWQEHITLLHQTPRLQTGTIFDNIHFARQSASKDAVFEAAAQAGVTDFSKELSEMIYEQNVGLSGGQIQRIALARIILRDAPIVLFDEPTNYLDEKNIQIFWQLIERWKGQKTMIVATHDREIGARMDGAQTEL